ncbi:MAG: hypothetical protein ACJ8CX_26395 [Microvirga sp.]
MSSRLSLATVLLLAVLGSARADSGPTDLFSLYLREHAVDLCGRALTEEQETELDEAQHLARLRSQLSLSEAAVLYRRARTVAVSARVALCSSEDDQPIELKDIETRADWTQAR